MVKCKSTPRLSSIKKSRRQAIGSEEIAFIGSDGLPSLTLNGSDGLPSPTIFGSDGLPSPTIFGSDGLPSPTLNGSDGLPSPIILMQTDTTVGFISQNHAKLSEVKSRPTSKPFIKVINSAMMLRIPNKFKKELRRAKKTTFIVKNQAFRISSNMQNSQILRNIQWHYSTSANEINKKFDREFCEQNADIMIENIDGLKELSSSKLIKLTNHKRKVLR